MAKKNKNRDADTRASLELTLSANEEFASGAIRVGEKIQGRGKVEACIAISRLAKSQSNSQTLVLQRNECADVN